MSQCLPPGSNLVMLSASIAISLSKGLTPDEINTLASLLTAIGDNLAIIGFQKELCEPDEA